MAEPMNQLDPVLLLLHIPKTGGTTLNTLVYEGRYDPSMPAGEEGGYLNYGIYHFPGGFDEDDSPGPTEQLARALSRPDVRLVLGHFPFGVHRLTPRPARYVTFLRDPVDRIVSLYYHGVHWASNEMDDLNAAGKMTESLVATRRKGFDNDQTRRLSGADPEFGRCTPAMLEQAKRNLRRHFAMVGLTERFDESVVLLKRILGWSDMLYLPRLVNPQRPARTDLADSVVEPIRDRNKLDLELYRYARELFERLAERQSPEFEDEVRTFRALNEAHIREYGVY